MLTTTAVRLSQISIFLVTLLSGGRAAISDRPTCSKTSACSCAFPDGNGVDLSELDNKDPTKPKFPDILPDSGNDEFSWNPCSAFDEGDCKSVALCNLHQNDKDVEYFPIGTQDTADFSFNGDGKLQLTYIYSGTGGAKRESFISLTCDETQDALFTATGETPSGSGLYYFDLTSKLACYPDSENSLKFPLSAGSIICIGFASVIVLYFTGGMVYQMAVRKQRGTNIIVHKDFLKGIPGLVKDGILFIFRRGTKFERTKLIS